MPVFMFPWAFLGLLALPALAGVYFFRKRSRRYPVSSLMLWAQQKRSREGGRRFHRFETPLLFFLELLALILLVLAAAGPRVWNSQGRHPLIVVLDDSFSMRAGGARSPRNLAAQAIQKEISRGLNYSVQFILAGNDLQLLGEPARTWRQARAGLKGWICRSPLVDLDRGIALAAAVGGPMARILVVTDHEPMPDLEAGRVEWWAFGTRRSNVAFVNAVRTLHDDREHCLLEIANLSRHRQTASLTLEGISPPDQPDRSTLDLAPGETRNLLVKFRAQEPPLRAKLGNDSLPFDNQVTLLPQGKKPVRVELRVQNQALLRRLEKCLEATGKAVLTSRGPELLFSDEVTLPSAGQETWRVHFLVEKEAAAYVGPFVLDRAHPLTEGLSLEGVIWAASKAQHLAGRPVITAGNVPLLTDAESLTGIHDLRIRLRPDLSTLQDSVNWPIFLWNLLDYRSANTPGFRASNLRLGTDAVFSPGTGIESVQLTDPGGRTVELPVRGDTARIRAENVGIYEVQTDRDAYRFASNALHGEESDLRQCASGRWGNWMQKAALRKECRSITWVFLLLAAAILTGHLSLASHRKGGTPK